MRLFLPAVAAILMTSSSALAQLEAPVQPGPQAAIASPQPATAQSRFAAALSYQVQRSNAPPAQCGCFTLQGLRAEIAFRPSRFPSKVPAALTHFSGVFELGGDHASNIHGNGLDLSLFTYMVGPRYSRKVGHKLTPFAQVLLGGVHGFDSTFPRRNGATASANSFALSAGGGVDLQLTKLISLRLIQVDYLKSALPNAASNGQSNLRISAGIVAQVEPLSKPVTRGRSLFNRLKAFLRHPLSHGP